MNIKRIIKQVSCLERQLPHTVNVDINAQYIISRMALDVQKYDVSKKINQHSTKRTNCICTEIWLRENASYGLMCEKLATEDVYVYSM